MSWTPPSPHEPRDDTRDDTVYNVPVGRVSEPPRFPGFLLAAVIAGLIGFAALGAIFFSGRDETSDATRSPRTTSSGAIGGTAPGTTGAPARSGEPVESGSPGPGTTGGASPEPGATADEVCAEPVAAVGGVRPALIEAFREYCREGVEAVLAEVAPEPDTIRELAWGYAADTPPGLGADLPHYVYLALDDQRRIRRYLVVSDTVSGVPTISEAGRVPALPADVFFSLSAAED
ncbi:MAG: hypothetical protein M3395_08830 [Chloroflexota bacterium]|nr:hypothetical protein [Chloroflexota bacterium]